MAGGDGAPMADPLMSLPATATMTPDQRAQAARDKAMAAAPDHPWCGICGRPVDLVTFTPAETRGQMVVSAQCHGGTVTRTVAQREAHQGAIHILGADLFKGDRR